MDAATCGARAAAEILAGEGAEIRYVRSTHLPDDETCFHVVEAASHADVDELCRRADLGRVRIVAAVETWLELAGAASQDGATCPLEPSS